MDPEHPDRLVMVAMDIASSLKLISGELSAIAGNLSRLEACLLAAASSSAATPNGERNLDLELRYPPAPAPPPKETEHLGASVLAEASVRRGAHGKFCPCVPCCEARARHLGSSGGGEDRIESARRRR